MLWSLWWVWAVAALTFGILEMLLPGAIFLGFAAGAAGIAVLLGVGGVGSGWFVSTLPLTLVTFAALSLIAWVIFRYTFGLGRTNTSTFDHDINDG